MDDLAFLRERIESYADYTNDDDRRLADEQIRAYVGEAVARVLERLKPAGKAAEDLARLMLRCQFADQSVVRAFDFNRFGEAEFAAIHAADRRLVALAEGAEAIDAAAAEGYVAEIDAALDLRAQIIINKSATTSQAPPDES